MIQCIREIITNFSEEIIGTASTPAINSIFHIRDEKDEKRLSEYQAIACHHTMVQLFFVSARARRDMQMPVAFLST